MSRSSCPLIHDLHTLRVLPKVDGSMAAAIRGVRILALTIEVRDDSARRKRGIALNLIALGPSAGQAHRGVSGLNQRDALVTNHELPSKEIPALGHAPGPKPPVPPGEKLTASGAGVPSGKVAVSTGMMKSGSLVSLNIGIGNRCTPCCTTGYTSATATRPPHSTIPAATVQWCAYTGQTLVEPDRPRIRPHPLFKVQPCRRNALTRMDGRLGTAGDRAQTARLTWQGSATGLNQGHDRAGGRGDDRVGPRRREAPRHRRLRLVTRRPAAEVTAAHDVANPK